MICPRCGFEYQETGAQAGATPASCPLCSGQWEIWELQFAPIPIPEVRAQIAAWLGQIPYPSMIEIAAAAGGLKVRFAAPPQTAQGAVKAWAGMVHQQTRWKPVSEPLGRNGFALQTHARLPVSAFTEGDPLFALGGMLMGVAALTGDATLRIWLLGKDTQLQEQLRALAAYSYGTEGGVGNDSPNPWGLRLGVWRFVLFLGIIIAGLSGGLYGAKMIPPLAGLIGIICGGVIAVVAMLGMLEWMKWRSVPKDVLERRITDALLRVAFTAHAAQPADIRLLAGDCQWLSIANEWPEVKSFAIALPAFDIAGMFAPPETGESSGVIDHDSVQDIPAPPPSESLRAAPFKIGIAVATGEPVGIDPDGHGVSTGGSRTGKTSFANAVLQQLIAKGDDAPGIFLVDPHVSLADAFIQAVDELPEPWRSKGIQRLRVITPDQPEVVPLNLLAVPEFTWAGNAIVQIGRRIWEDYWGPRMQAALLGLFRLAHAWNMNNPHEQMGLLHTVFVAFNAEWRHAAMAYLQPVERIGTLALDALLGQYSSNGGKEQGWVTEVISPVLSKAMALELSPWLFAAMHQGRFVDMEKWVREKAWIVLRLPSGEMGREGARLTAGVIYNVFDAAFRKATLERPSPFYFIVDEAQEIGSGMRLEAMLSEGAKFGARMFVLAQSLSMMRKVEGFEAVVQALLANTSTQAFFSPDPEDADLIRATLSSTVRYGAMTLDLPSLHHWLRARIGGRWQPPTLVKIQPLARSNHQRVQAIIREVIAAHPDDYAPSQGWQEQTVRAMQKLVNVSHLGLLGELLSPDFSKVQAAAVNDAAGSRNQAGDPNRLGF